MAMMTWVSLPKNRALDMLRSCKLLASLYMLRNCNENMDKKFRLNGSSGNVDQRKSNKKIKKKPFRTKSK